MTQEATRERLGDWMQTYTGQQFWPLDPRPEDFEIRDIAHALANICRFGGHSRRFYSVAQHSVLVSQLCPPSFAVHGLLHDAAEAYLGDIIRPLKYQAAFEMYREAEARLEGVLWQWAQLEWSDLARRAVSRADNIALATEGRDIMSAPPAPWGFPGGILPHGDPVTDRIEPWDPERAEVEFMARGLELHLASVAP